MSWGRESEEEKTLKEILEELRDENSLLRTIAAEQIAAQQLLQRIVDNTNPRQLTQKVVNIFSGDSIMANNALVVNFSDPSATAVVQPDNTVLFTGVADSAGVAVAGSTALTITDTDGVVSQWTVAFTVTTVGPPPQQLTQSVANVFSTPTP